MTHSENPQSPEAVASSSTDCHSRAGGNLEPRATACAALDSRLRGNDVVGEDESLPAHSAAVRQSWTPPRMRYFLGRLADTGNVLGVCREMGLSRQSVYALRARDAAFARAWQGAELRHRDALVGLCLERATVGVTEEIVVDGQLVERTRPDGAMLRHMLARADRRCDEGWPSARPAQQSELHFEALLDCIDPDAECAAEVPPDRKALLAEIEASANMNWKRDWIAETDPAPEFGPGMRIGRAPAPRGYASDDEAIEALGAYRRIMATPPEKIDISDLDPAEMDDWTEEQWLRAQRSDAFDFVYEDEVAPREGDACKAQGAHPERKDRKGEEDP